MLQEKQHLLKLPLSNTITKSIGTQIFGGYILNVWCISHDTLEVYSQCRGGVLVQGIWSISGGRHLNYRTSLNLRMESLFRHSCPAEVMQGLDPDEYPTIGFCKLVAYKDKLSPPGIQKQELWEVQLFSLQYTSTKFPLIRGQKVCLFLSSGCIIIITTTTTVIFFKKAFKNTVH